MQRSLLKIKPEVNKIEIRAWVYTRKQLSDALENESVSYVYCPIKIIDKSLHSYKDRIIILPPEYLADSEEKTRNELKKLYDEGFCFAAAHTVGHIELLRELGFTIFGGNRLNCVNSRTAEFLYNEGIRDIILSPELTVNQIGKISCASETGIIAYGHLPLMINRRCPINNGKPCNGKNCGKRIKDRLGNELSLICNENTVEILNSDVLILSDKLKDFKVQFVVLRFTVETEINPIIEAYKKGSKLNFKKITRGLYYRGVE